MLIGTRMRNALMAAIYRKSLKLSNSALQTQSTGKVVTLMSNDAQKMQVGGSLAGCWLTDAGWLAGWLAGWPQCGWLAGSLLDGS